MTVIVYSQKWPTQNINTGSVDLDLDSRYVVVYSFISHQTEQYHRLLIKIPLSKSEELRLLFM